MLSNICLGPSALYFAEIPMIFCRHISWVVLECSAKFRTNCSRFRGMVAILNFYFGLCPTKLGRDIARGEGHLVHKFDLKQP